MRNILHYFILTFFIILLTNCNKKCKENQIAFIGFTPNELAVNPYKTSAIITFKNLSGDSIVFSHGTRNSSTEDITKSRPEEDGCLGEYVEVSFNSFNKYCNNPDASLNIDLYIQFDFSSQISEKDFHLRLYGVDGFDGTYRFSDTNFIEGIYGSKIVAFLPSTSIGPKTYNNVYELSCSNPDVRYTEGISIAYYSIKDGLVGFISSIDGQLWYLDKATK